MKKIILVIALLALLALVFSQKNKLPSSETCDRLPQEEKPGCWQTLISQNLKVKGLASSLALVKKLYNENEAFASDCHSYLHLLGEEGYSLYQKEGKLSVSQETSYCGYGFYHGFIIALMRQGGDLKEAATFCDSANKQISGSSEVAGLDCFHGIGHGVTDYSADQLKKKGDEQKLVDASLVLCEGVAKTEEQVYRCTDGVFHSIGDIYLNDNYSFLLNRDDPLALCRNQKTKYQKTCYGAMAYLIMQVSGNDFFKALTFAKNLPPEFAQMMIQPMAGFEAYRTVEEADHTADIVACQSLNASLKEICIKGLVEGLTDFGQPDKEEVVVSSFCRQEAFELAEKDFCFSHAVDYFGTYFGQEKQAKLCGLIEEKYCQ